MMKYEFEDRLSYEVSNEEYKVIEHVYNWHPVFNTMSDPKQGIADLYKNYGMAVINGMVEVADASVELEGLERRAQAELLRIRDRKKYVADGDMSVERAIAFIEKAYNESNNLDELKAKLEKADLKNYEEAVELGNYRELLESI